MTNLNTTNQSKDKIVSIPGYHIGSLTCYNANEEDGKSVNIQLTSLEEMWYGHEETINHPAGSEYPLGVNEPFRKLMLDRVRLSVLDRTGIDIANFEQIIHASSYPGKDKNGNFIFHPKN